MIFIKIILFGTLCLVGCGNLLEKQASRICTTSDLSNPFMRGVTILAMAPPDSIIVNEDTFSKFNKKTIIRYKEKIYTATVVKDNTQWCVQFSPPLPIDHLSR